MTSTGFCGLNPYLLCSFILNKLLVSVPHHMSNFEGGIGRDKNNLLYGYFIVNWYHTNCTVNGRLNFQEHKVDSQFLFSNKKGND